MVDVSSVPKFQNVSEFPDIPMLQNGWRPTGGPVNPAADEGLLNWPLQELTKRTTNLHDRLTMLAQTADIQMTVGTGGQYQTINAALVAMSMRRAVFKPGGFLAVIRLLPGFIMAEEVHVSGVDLSWITITGDDPETVIRRSALITPVYGSEFAAFYAAAGGALPFLDHLFTMDTSGAATNRNGIRLGRGGRASLQAGAGIKNAGGNGAYLTEASTLSGNGTVFSGAGVSAIHAVGGSVANAVAAVLSGCTGVGVQASVGSQVTCNNADISGCAGGGVLATLGGDITCNAANCRSGPSDASTDIRVSFGGIARATQATGGTSITPNTVTSSGIIFK